MKKTVVLFTILLSTCPILAQISPTPVINNEIRDGSSVRSRAIELERAKRDANKVIIKDSKELAAKFAEIKEEFEDIQKLQATIIKVYTTGKAIDYTKIANSAAEMHKKSLKLNENLFNPSPTKTEEKKDQKPKSVRDLIVELDNAIGKFIGSPLFSNNKIVDSKTSEKAQTDLQNIIELSEKLFLEAKKLN
jgi:cell fate (sporulation/competence/biofilm development) regulator YlbF (YheA/YmcA/DUF963 family)